MSYACQRDSYLRQFTTTVKSCDAATLSLVVNGKKQKTNGYNVVLEDTILFPEGGGQPDDRGTINDVEVLSVIRKGANALHFLPVPFDLGSEVVLKVNWERRWDHMQHHSGQHLITALADSMYGYATTSWNLGEQMSFIELDTGSMSADQVTELEQVVNEKIRECVPMYSTFYEGVSDPKLKEVRTRGLPDDHVGVVRTVTIEGIDTNMCCGTHVSNMAHLQAIKILGVEKGKKGKVNLTFVVGGRVLNYLGKCYNNEKTFTSLLKGHPDQHASLVEKLQNSFKTANKNSLTLLRDVALLEAKLFKLSSHDLPLFSLHRREGDHDFMSIIANEIDDSTLKFLTVGDNNGAGLFLLAGKPELVQELGPRIAEKLEGKGAGKAGRFQGKATKLGKRSQAEQLIQERLLNNQTVDNAAQ